MRRALAALGCLGILTACTSEGTPEAVPSSTPGSSSSETVLPTAPPVDEEELQRQEELEERG